MNSLRESHQEIKQPNNSHNAPAPYPTMHHFATEKYTLHHCVIEICTFLLQNGALWDMGLGHCGICEISLFTDSLSHNKFIITWTQLIQIIRLTDMRKYIFDKTNRFQSMTVLPYNQHNASKTMYCTSSHSRNLHWHRNCHQPHTLALEGYTCTGYISKPSPHSRHCHLDDHCLQPAHAVSERQHIQNHCQLHPDLCDCYQPSLPSSSFQLWCSPWRIPRATLQNTTRSRPRRRLAL